MEATHESENNGKVHSNHGRSRLIGTMKNGPITAPGKPTADFRDCDAQISQSREFADFRWHFTFIIGRVHRERRGKGGQKTCFWVVISSRGLTDRQAQRHKEIVPESFFA